MKLITLALLATLTTLHAAPAPAQTAERWQAAAVQKYPALKEAGSPLNKQFLAVIAAKRASEPGFFKQPDWPMRAADMAQEEVLAADAAAEAAMKKRVMEKELEAQEKARAEELRKRAMTAAQKDQAEIDRMDAEEVAQWETQKAKWVFDRLMIGDSEDVVMRKLNLSKLVTARVSPKARVELSSRYRWVIGERKFNMDFEMKEGLVAITFASLSEKTTELGTLVREDWEKLRVGAIERFGPPTRSIPYPTTKTLRRGGMTETDVWDRPVAPVALGVSEEDSMCNPILRIGEPPRAGGKAPAKAAK